MSYLDAISGDQLRQNAELFMGNAHDRVAELDDLHSLIEATISDANETIDPILRFGLAIRDIKARTEAGVLRRIIEQWTVQE